MNKISIFGRGLIAKLTAYSLVNFNNTTVEFITKRYKSSKNPFYISINNLTAEFLNNLNLKSVINKGQNIREIKIYDSFKEIHETYDLNFTSGEKKKVLNYIVDKNYLEETIEKELNKKINFKIIENPKKLGPLEFSDNLKIITSYDFSSLFVRKNLNLLFKDYQEIAYTFSIQHREKENNIAHQFFLRDGPIAFLPSSNNETFVVWNIKKKGALQNIINNEKKIQNFFKDNFSIIFSNIEKISKIHKNKLSFYINSNETFKDKNFLAFGPLINKIHPLTGQGFNIFCNDILNLKLLLEEHLQLGLNLNSSSLIKSFYDKSEPNNFIFPILIDGLRNFFDNKGIFTHSSKQLLRIINKSTKIKNFFMYTANTGLRI
jgi:2-octaprenyl-6-methoxyphenol hydroxylase